MERSTDKPHYIEKLPAGDYTLSEVKAPDGYAFSESVPFTVLPTGEVQQFEMRDDVIKVEISKVDITTNKELPGAELIITNKDGKEIERWVSRHGYSRTGGHTHLGCPQRHGAGQRLERQLRQSGVAG